MGLFDRLREIRAETVGFDRATLVLPWGEVRTLTRQEFEALPLAERVRAILGKGLKFFRGDKEVMVKEALGE